MAADEILIGLESYGAYARKWLDEVGQHYLQNAPPGCLFAISVRSSTPGLFASTPQPGKDLFGLCLVGRPTARMIVQDGSVGEITRMVLVAGLPYGTASKVLLEAARHARARGMEKLIAYHDRTRHTGCIYRKAGFKKSGTSTPSGRGWGNRPGRVSAGYAATPKRRWSLDLSCAEEVKV